MMRIPAFSLALLGFGAEAAKHDQYARTLKFNSDGHFKIVTFSDLYFNDNSEDYLQT